MVFTCGLTPRTIFRKWSSRMGQTRKCGWLDACQAKRMFALTSQIWQKVALCEHYTSADLCVEGWFQRRRELCAPIGQSRVAETKPFVLSVYAQHMAAS